MQKQFVEAKNTRGDALGGAIVTIYLGGTKTLAPIFTDKLGTVPKDNPFQITDPSGEDFFYIANGSYDRIISVPRYTDDVANDVQAFDPADGTIAGGPADTDALPEGSTNQYFTQARARASTLTGVSVADASAVLGTDTVVQGIGKLQAQVNNRPAVNAPVALTTATNLATAAHGNRQIVFNGANSTLTVTNDATGGWAADDEVIVVTDAASAGVPTLSFPGGTTLTGGTDVVIGGVRKGTDTWQPYCIARDVFASLKRGLVPAAGASPSATKFLTETGAWAVPSVVGGGSTWRWGGLQDSLLGIPIAGGNGWTVLGSNGLSLLDSCNGAVSTMDGSSFVKSLQRVTYGAAAAAISRMAGYWLNGVSPLLTPSASVSGRGGFSARITAVITDAIASGQFGIGFCQNVPSWTNAVEPSAMVNTIMLAGDSGDGQLSLMYNDGSGSCTKTVLNGGAGFANNTNATNVYQLDVRFNATGASRNIDYTCTNLTTSTSVTGNITTNLPVEAIRLSPFAARGSANNASQCFIECLPFAAGDYLF